jgi:UDP-glucuronate 4-epimerase
MRVLVTGAAGFIGSHTVRRLAADGHEIFGVDNLNDYYDVGLKNARLESLAAIPSFNFLRLDITDRRSVDALFDRERFDRVIHLAAQAGVRYSLTNPQAYVDSNVTGTLNILEGCRYHRVKHLVFASTSSVYGMNTNMPFSPHQSVDHPLSLYASTKRAGELMCHNYSALFGLPVTVLRFFTVYGPWGRPDMALFLFTKNILAGKPIDVFNSGDHKRDFTFVADIAEGVVRSCYNIASMNPAWTGACPDPATSNAPFRIYNIGNNSPVELSRYIQVLEACLGRKAEKNMLPLQLGDVPDTFADVTDLEAAVGYRPSTTVEDGVRAFVDWYRSYFRV